MNFPSYTFIIPFLVHILNFLIVNFRAYLKKVRFIGKFGHKLNQKYTDNVEYM